MAESIAEAEREAKEGKSFDLTGEIMSLEKESTVAAPKLSDMSDDEKRAFNKKAAAIEAEALDSRSQINFDGKDISIKMDALDEERNNDEK